MEYSNRLTNNARNALNHAEVLAFLGKSDKILTTHILLAIVEQTGTTAAEILKDFNIDADLLRRSLNIHPGVVVSNGEMSKSLSDGARLSMRLAMEFQGAFQHKYCGTAHLLYGILTQREGQAYQMLYDSGGDPGAIAIRIHRYYSNKFAKDFGLALDDYDMHVDVDFLKSNGMIPANEAISQEKPGGLSMLDRYSRNLTSAARQGEIDPVVGRDSEIDRMITIISQRTKNNPILVGEAGVGKTAIVEGLAQRISDGNVPQYLAKTQILELDLASMVAGSKYRGEFEERFKGVIAEVEEAESIIVFIDEIHLLVGAGSAEGSIDAANILKPALARGKFRLIGATTVDEYRKKIEKDLALTRRLRKIDVFAPSEQDTVRILQGISDKYRDYHGVRFGDEVIEEIVRLSERYMPDSQQPDKSIDILDETAARLRAHKSPDSRHNEKVDQLRGRIAQAQIEIDNAVANQDYERAALHKMNLSRLEEKINKLQSQIDNRGVITIGVGDVADTVSRISGVPIKQLKKSDVAKLMGLERRLARRVVGQGDAISAVSRAIRRSRAGVADGNRPIGSFIFLGPTGVGKTELAKALSDEIFGVRDSMIRVDMSELGERHNVARLIGAPAGYVGYEDGGSLVDRVRRHPYSVVLFDEIEKAHPDVFNVLLQILEDGMLTDGHGRRADFRNAIIILTSNIGAENLAADRLGFGKGGEDQADAIDQRKGAVVKALQQSMRPELVNRFDSVVVFDALNSSQISKICDLMIRKLNERLAIKGVSVVITSRMRRHLVKAGYDSKYGARPLRRAIQDNIENELADQMVAGKIRKGDVVRIDYHDNHTIIGAVKEHANQA